MSTKSLIKICRQGHQMVLEYEVADGCVIALAPTKSVPPPEAPDQPDLLMRICWCGEVVLATPPEHSGRLRAHPAP